MTAIKHDPRVRIFVNEEWTDITEKVRVGDGIEIFHGQRDESSKPNPAWCKMVLDNRAGDFTPRNPMGAYAGYLNVNTPICVFFDEITDSFDRTVADSWGTSDTGETYLNVGVGGSVLDSDFNVNGTQATHSVPTTSAYRLSYFEEPTPAPYVRNNIQRIKYVPGFSDVTGAQIEPGNLITRLATVNSYYMLRATVQADESVTVAIMNAQSTLLGGPVTVPGLTHQSGQGIWLMFAAIDNDLMGTAWADGDDPPTDWLVTAEDDTFANQFGWYGVRSGVAGGNTNSKPITFAYDDYTVWVAEFCGEIPDFPQEFTVDVRDDDDDGVIERGDAVVAIEAAGLARRLSEGGSALTPTSRRWYEQFGSTLPDWYWPLDDGELSSVGRVTRAPVGYGPEDVPFVFSYASSIDPDSANEKHFGQSKIAAWLPNGVTLLPDNSIFFTALPAGAADVTANAWTVDWIWTLGSNTQTNIVMGGYLDPGVTILGVNIDVFSVTVDTIADDLIISPGLDETDTTVALSSLDVNIVDGRAHHFRFRVNPTGGTDIHWLLYIDGIEIGDEIESAHPSLASISTIQFVNTNTTDGAKNVGVTSVALFVSDDPFGDQQLAYNRIFGAQGETAKFRAARLSEEENVDTFIIDTPDPGGTEMGPQYIDKVIDQFHEIARTDGGFVVERTDCRALNYFTLQEIRNQEEINWNRPLSTGLVIDVLAGELAPKFKPVDDTQRLRNKIRAFKRNGGDYIFEKTDSRLGTADPKLGGAGVYAGNDVAANPFVEGQLIDIAQREVSEGTVDKARYPQVTINLMSYEVQADVDLRRSILDVKVGSRFQMINMNAQHIYEDADLLTIGVTRFLTNHEHTLTWNTMPFTSFDTFHVETEGSILGTDSSTVVNIGGIDATEDELRVVTDGNALWTTQVGSLPLTARIGIPPTGEDVSVTAVDTTSPGYRSVGTVSSGDNASTTPGLPAGHVAGDTLVLVTAIRTTSATADLPAGYTLVADQGHIKIAVKASTGGSEVAPTCTYSGGAAGASTTSFIMCFTNCPFGYNSTSVATQFASNSSAQNIAYPASLAVNQPRSNGLRLYVLWKQDDYVSISEPTGITEIIEAFTTLGNDQGLYAAYELVPNVEDTGGGEFTVNGGGVFPSKAFLIYFSNPQTLIVDRSQNNVTRSWPAQTPIRIAYPKPLG